MRKEKQFLRLQTESEQMVHMLCIAIAETFCSYQCRRTRVRKVFGSSLLMEKLGYTAIKLCTPKQQQLDNITKVCIPISFLCIFVALFG
jgi:hypothetical protein